MALDRQAKLSRRIVIISVLVALSVWYLSDVLDFDKRELWSFVTSSFLLVFLVIIAAFAGVVSFKFIQARQRGKDRSDNSG